MAYSVIVNADDFGLSESANEAIRYCFEHGLVDYTSLMVNMPYTEQAVEMAKKCGFWDKVGLHLNLYEGQPLNDQLRYYTDFYSESAHELTGAYCESFVKRFAIPCVEGIEVSKELELQIKKFLSYKPCGFHVDSHRHSHNNPSIWKYMKPLFVRYRVESTRIARNLYFTERHGFKELYKDLYNADIKRHGWKRTDRFGNAVDFLEMTSQHKCEMAEDEKVEIMTHPNYEDGKLVNNGSQVSFDKIAASLTNENRSCF